MLGGPRSFAEGGYGGTPVADALPLHDRSADARLGAGAAGAPEDRRRRAPGSRTRRRRSMPTRERRRRRAGPSCRWSPPSTRRCRRSPGATVLLNGTDERGRARVVLASHQYGRGKAIAFTVQDSWKWQMHASIPLEDDQTHENFWRQMMRWLVDGVPEQRRRPRQPDRVEPGEPVTVEATVVDKSVRRAERRDGDGAGRPARRHHGERAAAVDRRARRPVSRHLRQHRAPAPTK